MSRLSHVFLFDSDAKGRDTLVYGLEGDAVSVRVPTSGDEARAMLRGAPRPEVIVVVLREAEREAPALLRYLAESPNLATIPRLVLASADALPEHLQGLKGPQSFVPLPAYVRDVVTAAKLLGAGSAGKDDGEIRIEGSLADYGLLFVVRTMVSLHRSGVVQVERGARKGEIRISDGEIVSAEVGAREGQGALHQLLLWEEAKLQVVFRPVTHRQNHIPQGEELLDDLERFLRDFASATKNVGHAQSLFVQDAEKVAASVDSIAPEIIPVMKLFDGQRNLGDVLEDSPFTAFETLQTMTRLTELGILRRKAIEKPTSGLPSKPRPAAEPRPLPVQEWVNRGADAPVVKATPATAPPPDAPASAANSSGADPTASDPLAEQRSPGHRRRSRRRTGEIPITSEVSVATTVPVEVPPSAGALPTTVEKPAAPAPALPVPPSPTIPAGGNGRRGTITGRATHRPGPEQQEVHGELRALNRERSITPLPAHMPTVLVDLGEDETTEPEPAHLIKTAPGGLASEAIPVPISEENSLAATPLLSRPEDMSSTDASHPSPDSAAPAAPIEAPPAPDPQPPVVAAVAAPPAPAPEAVPTPLRDTAGVRSAEIDTGMRPAPAPALLEAPPSGPSIMLDADLVAEMDAFELANTPRTPPPQLVSPPPAVSPEPRRPTPAPAPAPEAPAAPAPAPAPAPVPAPAPAPVPAPAPAAIVSFVKGPANATPHAGLNSAPTVPMSPVTSAASSAGGAIPNSQNTGGTPAEGISKRRVSGEFNELEADFFAREKDLYQNANEPAESFDDLDVLGGKSQPGAKNGLKNGPDKS